MFPKRVVDNEKFLMLVNFMLSVQECKKYLGNLDLTDEQVAEIRDSLYFVVTNILDNHYEKQYDKRNKN